MNDLQSPKLEPTAVDDVRRVREKIACESAGNLLEHIKETNRVGEQLRAKLNVRLVLLPREGATHDGTRG